MVPISITVFYFVTILIAIVILVLSKMRCCTRTKIKYYDGADLLQKRHTDEIKQQKPNLVKDDIELTDTENSSGKKRRVKKNSV